MSNKSRRKGKKQQKGDVPRKKVPIQSKKHFFHWISLLSPTGKISAAVALLLTVIGTYYTFSPKISISYAEPLTQLDLRSTPFVVRNNSLLPVNNIKFRWYSRRTDTDNNITIIGLKFDSKIPPIPRLNPGEATTFFLPFGFANLNMKYADIDISVEYRPAILPFEKEQSFRFTGKVTDHGVRWFDRALSEQ